MNSKLLTEILPALPQSGGGEALPPSPHPLSPFEGPCRSSLVPLSPRLGGVDDGQGELMKVLPETRGDSISGSILETFALITGESRAFSESAGSRILKSNRCNEEAGTRASVSTKKEVSERKWLCDGN